MKIDQARNEYGNLMQEYEKESCYDDDDFRPTQARGEAAQHRALPAPQRLTNKAGKPLQVNFPEFRALTAEATNAIGLSGMALLMMMLLLAPVGL